LSSSSSSSTSASRRERCRTDRGRISKKARNDNERRRKGRTDEKGLLLSSRRLVIELSGLDNLSVDGELPLSGSKDVFLDRLVGDETEDLDDLLLTDSMGSILGLQIGVGVPVRIVAGRRGKKDGLAIAWRLLWKQGTRGVHDDGIGSLQVEAETSCSSREDKDLVGRVGLVEFGDEVRSVVCLGRSVESEHLLAVTSVDEVVLEDVHDVDHLEEDEHLRKPDGELISRRARKGDDMIGRTR
jgi:hypothetical protein